jgi:hypothetical protein
MFLPKLETANNVLGDASSNLENVDSDEEYVEMVLTIGKQTDLEPWTRCVGGKEG